MLSAFLYCGLIIFIYATTWFAISVYKKRNDVADIAWGLGYLIICIFLLFVYHASVVVKTLFALVTIWGLRLSVHIYLRNKNKKEDFRYRVWRDQWGKTFYWRSYLQVFLLQGFFLLIIISPVIHAAAAGLIRWNFFTWLGLAGWITGFYFQAISDWQLTVFKSKPENKGLIIQTGLWKYSRHPNYFGEIVMWWSIFIITIPLANSFYFIVSPLTITFLLVYVSGIPMLEKKYAGNTAFEAYKKQTSALLPMPPVKN